MRPRSGMVRDAVDFTTFSITARPRTVACVLRKTRAMRTASGAFLALALVAPLTTAGLAGAQTPASDFRTYVVIAESQIKLGSGGLILGGNAAVTNAGGILMVGRGASCPVTADAVGDHAKLM